MRTQEYLGVLMNTHKYVAMVQWVLMSTVEAMRKSANACSWGVMSAFGTFAPCSRALMVDDGCSRHLWLLMSTLEPSSLLMSAHEHSQVAMTSYEHSWACCHGAISNHEPSLVLMSTHENGVTSTHKSHGAMLPPSWVLLGFQEWSWTLLSAHQCSSPWFNNEQKC